MVRSLRVREGGQEVRRSVGRLSGGAVPCAGNRGRAKGPRVRGAVDEGTQGRALSSTIRWEILGGLEVQWSVVQWSTMAPNQLPMKGAMGYLGGKNV